MALLNFLKYLQPIKRSTQTDSGSEVEDQHSPAKRITQESDGPSTSRTTLQDINHYVNINIRHNNINISMSNSAKYHPYLSTFENFPGVESARQLVSDILPIARGRYK